MRHTDARDGMGLNMMVFAVAGTGTGKEAIFQSVTLLMHRLGVSQAMHGKIKSEQEIYRNLLRNQGAFYSIDEIGIMLQKVTQAAKGTGAAYYIAVIGALMEIYSKSQGILTITGDLKEEIKEGLMAELAKLNKLKDKGENPAKLEPMYQRLNQALMDADSGMRDPFLTIFGTTTPETFDATVNTENVKNGFIARALILRETENNPRWKDDFCAQELSDQLVMRLMGLYWGGHTHDASQHGQRVERQGDKVSIVTRPDASEMLDEIRDVFWEMGEQHKHSSGMEGVTRRSWEMCSKISLLLAMADGGVRTVDHVLYGFAMAYSDTNAKITLARSKDEEGATAADKAATYHNRILSMLSRDDPVPAWKIVKALKMDKATAQPYFDALIQANKITMNTEKPVSGKTRHSVMLA
jgi:hypothetical protein